jgi:hypothetical protein
VTKRATKKIIYSSLLVLAGVGIALNLASRSDACLPTIKRGDRVLLIGDSFGVGTAPHFKALCAEAGVQFQSAAHVGDSATHWLGGKLTQAMAFGPTVVMVSLGTNDTAGSTPQQAMEANFRKLVAQIQSHGASVVWILPPSLPFEDRASAAARSLGVPVFESAQLDLPKGPDNLHPSAKGYAAWAGAAWATITCGPPKPIGLAGTASFVRPFRPTRRARPAHRSRKVHRGVLGSPR